MRPRLAWATGVLAISTTAALFGGASFAQSLLSGAAADQVALRAIPGSRLLHSSADRYKGAPVWDIHISSAGSVWDVKVSRTTGAVLLKRLSREQPASAAGPENSSAASASSTAENRSKSASAADRAEHAKGTDRTDRKDRAAAAAPAYFGGIALNAKLTAVPSAYRTYVDQALSGAGGTLKWVKFSRGTNGGLQLNIKIRRTSGGTAKVTDAFSAAGQLVSSRTSTDN